MTVTDDLALTRRVTLRAGGRQDMAFDVDATGDERHAVARLLDVTSIAVLRATGQISRVDRMYVIVGDIRATVEQPCVVTWVPVVTDLELKLERWVVVGPAPLAVDVEVRVDDREIDYVAEPEVDVGAMAVEELALALPLQPRADDADQVMAAAAAEDDASGPFADLARWQAAP